MRSAGTSIKPSEWVDLQGSTAFLVLPQADTQTVVALPKTSSLKSVSKEIKVLVATSSLGQRLFSCCLRGILHEEIADLMELAQKDLLSEPITEDRMLKTLNLHATKVESLDCIAVLPQRRETTVGYRGLRLKLVVRSPQEEVEFALMAAVRATAAASGVIPELPGENAIVKSGGDNVKVDGDVIKKAKAVRRCVLDLLSQEAKEEDMNGDAVMAAVLAC